MFRPSSGPSSGRSVRTAPSARPETTEQEKPARALSPQAAVDTIVSLTAERNDLAEKVKKLQAEVAQSEALRDAKQRAEKKVEELAKARLTVQKQVQALQETLNAETAARSHDKDEARREAKDLQNRNRALGKDVKKLGRQLAALEKDKTKAERKARDELNQARESLMLAVAGNPHSRQNEEELRNASKEYVAAVKAEAAKKVAAAEDDLRAANEALAAEQRTAAALREALAAATTNAKALEDRVAAVQAERTKDVAAANRRVDDATRLTQKAEEALHAAKKQWADQADAQDTRHKHDLDALWEKLEAEHSDALAREAESIDRMKQELVGSFAAEHTARLRSLEKKHEQELADLQKQYEKQFDEIIEDYEDKLGVYKERLLKLHSQLPIPSQPTPPLLSPPKLPAEKKENRRASS